ncbi:hypothetical protein TOPH_00349 [Tolypocladium ophioglossoides CBS 100239]|uniref:Uncharacterized protein n=1 Tax=Tolypocladium ophioglossoides (strain CBS 100239) TaxID=1163406 RepID=A0A0L0NM40_TOLOC|nr:hypothetical protein TOPH_00349 [Tolypocladium ophioglossoides CBS 100239]
MRHATTYDDDGCALGQEAGGIVCTRGARAWYALTGLGWAGMESDGVGVWGVGPRERGLDLKTGPKRAALDEETSHERSNEGPAGREPCVEARHEAASAPRFVKEGTCKAVPRRLTPAQERSLVKRQEGWPSCDEPLALVSVTARLSHARHENGMTALTRATGVTRMGHGHGSEALSFCSGENGSGDESATTAADLPRPRRLCHKVPT